MNAGLDPDELWQVAHWPEAAKSEGGLDVPSRPDAAGGSSPQQPPRGADRGRYA